MASRCSSFTAIIRRGRAKGESGTTACHAPPVDGGRARRALAPPRSQPGPAHSAAVRRGPQVQRWQFRCGGSAPPRTLSQHQPAASDRDHRARDIAAVTGSEQDVCRRQLRLLAGTLERRALAEMLDFVGRLVDGSAGSKSGHYAFVSPISSCLRSAISRPTALVSILADTSSGKSSSSSSWM